MANYQSLAEEFGTWAEDMREFIESEELDKIFLYLRSRIDQGRNIFPERDSLFKAFLETPKDQLKAIFFLQDPYYSKKGKRIIADGIAMSCSNTKELQPSLSAFYTGLEKYIGTKIKRNPDLKYLCNQGIMMLNTSLTVEEGRPSCHSSIRVLDSRIKLWEPLIKFFLERVISKFNNLPLIFCGKESQYYERYVNPLQHYIFKVEHPSAAARSERLWNTQDIFRKIDILVAERKAIINWY